MKEAFVIGIAGGSGSGKSTFAQRLKDRFPQNIALVSCDNYYLARHEMPLEERKKQNYDSPEGFEFDLMIRPIADLKQGKDIACPVYDFTQHDRSDQVLTIAAKPVVLIDGILIFTEPKLRQLMDMRIYVETDADERILRRVRRDMRERGRDLDGIIDQYLTTVKPMHNAFVEPTKVFADIIINGGMNDAAYDLVKNKIQRILEKEVAHEPV
jgi:uridine kinase